MPPADEAAPAPVTRHVDLDWRSVAAIMVAFVGLLALTGIVRAAPRAFTVLVAGTLLALALSPLVAAAQGWFGGRRKPAVAVVLAGLLLVVALAIVLLGPPAVDQARDLGADLDRVVTQIEDLPIVGDDLQEAGTADAVQRWIEDLPDRLEGDATPIADAARRLADGLLVAGFVALVTITLLLDAPRLIGGVRRVVPARRRPQADRLGRLTYEVVGRYVAGSVLVAGIAGVATLTAGLVLGVPLTPLLAVWVAIFDLVPQIGGAAGGIPFVLLAFTEGPGTGVAAGIFFVLYLQFENHVLSPLVVGQAVRLSPPATMTAALVGVSAGGVIGALIAVPLVAAVKVVYLEIRQRPHPIVVAEGAGAPGPAG